APPIDVAVGQSRWSWDGVTPSAPPRFKPSLPVGLIMDFARAPLVHARRSVREVGPDLSRKTILPIAGGPIEYKRHRMVALPEYGWGGPNRRSSIVMDWIPGLYGNRRRPRDGSLPGAIETLENRALLANGITPAPGPPIHGVA